MNKLTLLFGVVLLLAVVNARHYGDRNDEEKVESEDEIRRTKDMRHRRRRWQSSYGYDYPPPNYQYADRRDYERNTQEVLQNIYRLLEEISTYVRRPPPPPPPPQPIYIPYPMPYFPQPTCKPCSPPNSTGGETPDVTKRIKGMEDSNQNWGLVVSNENDYDDGGDGSRPISFDPIVPKQLMKRPTPKVEHGSVQAATRAPSLTTTTPAPRAQFPGMCNAAILSCCGLSQDTSQQKQCFVNIGCSDSYDEGVCNPGAIQQALDSFKLAYSPVN